MREIQFIHPVTNRIHSVTLPIPPALLPYWRDLGVSTTRSDEFASLNPQNLLDFIETKEKRAKRKVRQEFLERGHIPKRRKQVEAEARAKEKRRRDDYAKKKLKSGGPQHTGNRKSTRSRQRSVREDI